MKKKYHQLIEKLRLDHKKYRELIDQSHLIVAKILEVDEYLDDLYDEPEYDEDVEQSYWEQRDHLMTHLNENYDELQNLGVSMSKDEFYDLIDFQNIRFKQIG
tara:strand:+ start:641 stop:949 length:309 start_codon:yes stop_codon:yes gene_type:complete